LTALPIATEAIAGKQVFFVDQNAQAACFDAGLNDDMVKEIARRKALRSVIRDASYGPDAVKINAEAVPKNIQPVQVRHNLPFRLAEMDQVEPGEPRC
jgi:adenine-specific DNA-methyltransferase